MHRQLTAFVEEPCHATFIALRAAVLKDAPLALTALDIAQLGRLLAEEKFQSVLDRIDALPLSKILSPRVHYYAAEAAAALGDEQTVELERYLFVLSLRGLLTTGDGSRANPYLVSHATDAHDILEALEHSAARQSLEQEGGKLLDIVLCSDGREICFDLTQTLHGDWQQPPRRRVKRPRRRLVRSRR